MSTMIIFIAFGGLLLAIVINSLADHLPPDELGVRHRPTLPECRYCGARHAPVYWLALSGFLFKGGQCEHCAAPRRIRHGLVELGLALAWAYAWNWAGGAPEKFLPAAVILGLFMLIAVIDIEHRLILWNVAVASALIIGVMNSLLPERGLAKTLEGGLAGYGFWFLVFGAGQVFSMLVARWRGQALDEIAFGGGDVNLGGIVGLAVGWSGILFTLPLTIFSAAAFSLVYLAVQAVRGKASLFMVIPYGPFIILGALTIYFYGKEFAAFYLGR
jgi:prepilin signal peptidase PulO-like enzyme (type II secretory pathway)